jgi:hypothetical protein
MKIVGDDGTGSRSCPLESFNINGVEPLSSVPIVSFYQIQAHSLWTDSNKNYIHNKIKN